MPELKCNLITAELIADMRKAVPVLVRASEVLELAGGTWHPEDLRYAAENFQRALDCAAREDVRQLRSLDCAEARDGTVRRDSNPEHPWLYRYHQGAWWWKTPSARSWHPLVMHDAARLKLILSGCGPYVAVGQSAGEAH